LQVSGDIPGVHPIAAQLQPPLAAHWLQVGGAPTQVGLVTNGVGLAGNFESADVQQIRSAPEVHSWALVHCFGQVARHTPLQQISLRWMQSADCVQVFGQGVKAGLRHSPSAITFGSSAFAPAQQISPAAVLHSVLSRHDLGQLAGARQSFWR
jgi:hypothetical protein